jgi:sugar lactone lactonase YvrE
MNTVLSLDKARVFYDGIFDEPVRLAHPEGVAVDDEGNVWCGTENGDLLKINADGSGMQRVASTGGFITGIAFDNKNNLYACDIKHCCMFKLEVDSRELSQFGNVPIKIPNYPVIDLKRNALYVSDSYSFEEAGPGVWRYDLDTGEASLWFTENMAFANGMALSPESDVLYVVESMKCRIVKIFIGTDGSVSNSEIFVEGVTEFPDGIALDMEGNVYISCYEPSQIYRANPDGSKLELFIKDKVSTLLSHPTNMAFRGSTMFTTNLGRWHITKIETSVSGIPLPVSY